MMRSGSTLVLAGLVLASACAESPFTIPVPLRFQTVVAVDKDGNKIVAGSFAGKLAIARGTLTSAGGTDIFVAKVDKNGNAIFSKSFGGKGNDAATGVALNEDGSIVLAGTFQGEFDFGGKPIKAEVKHPNHLAVFVARIDTTGAVGWVKQIAVSNLHLPTQVSVAVGPDKNIVVGASATVRVPTNDNARKEIGQSVMLQVLGADGERREPPADMPKVGQSVTRQMLGSAGQTADLGFSMLSQPVTCGHSPCTEGNALTAGCGPNECVAWICGEEPSCCRIGWSKPCVDMVKSFCQMRCNCEKICSPGSAYYPDACDCVVDVVAAHPSCGERSWNAECIQEANNTCHKTCTIPQSPPW